MTHAAGAPALAEILARYDELAGTVARMLELARARDWQPLPALDARCQRLYEQLRALDPGGLSILDTARILSLASRIRADQDELSTLVRPQFVQLARRLADLQRQT